MGDDVRFAELYRTHYRRVVGLCRRYLGPERDAEAVAQEAFIRAWESWETYAGPRPFWPWVATIARRLCINEARASVRRDQVHTHAARDLAVVERSAEDKVTDTFESAALQRALTPLSARQRRLLVLRDVEGWSYDDIARFERVTVEAVRGSLKRARAALRRSFDKLPGGLLGGALPGFRLGEWVRLRVARLARTAERWAGLGGGRVFGSQAVPTAVALAILLATGTTSPTDPALRAPGEPVPGPVALAPPSAVVVDDESSGRVASSKPQPGPEAAGADVSTGSAPSSPMAGSGYEFTASPSYEQDRTVFATGQGNDCDAAALGCRTLFKSSDGGSSWTRLAASGFQGGHLMLPPAYPADPRIFAASATELSVSDDGGATFRRLVTVFGRPTMSPRFSDGDPRILFGSWTNGFPLGIEYDVAADRLQPLSLPLPLGTTPMAFAFSPSYAEDGRILVSGYHTSGLSHTPSLFSCGREECSRVEGVDGAYRQIAWAAGSKPTALAWDTFTLHRSSDGKAFEPTALPGGGTAVIQDALSTGDGRIFVSVFDGTYADSRLYVSDDDGATWDLLEDDVLLHGLTALPDGTLLAAPSWVHGTGIRCSIDGGRTWADACPRRATS